MLTSQNTIWKGFAIFLAVLFIIVSIITAFQTTEIHALREKNQYKTIILVEYQENGNNTIIKSITSLMLNQLPNGYNLTNSAGNRITIFGQITDTQLKLVQANNTFNHGLTGEPWQP